MTLLSEIPEIVDDLHDGFGAGVLRSVADRETQLRQLRRMLVEQEQVFSQTLAADLGKSPIEAYSTEIGFTIGEIDHALHHLRAWVQSHKVRLPMHLRPGAATVVQEPYGTVLVIAPWNYPLQLVLAPLVPALAAGNVAVLKPSEVAPATAAAVAEWVPKYLDERAVRVVTGGVDETTALLAQRFDHIFYTGNGTVGRVVMRAAAEHLTPVTLELGGKSPAIVTRSANVAVAARRIAWGKFINAGQTCVAPDFALVDEAVHDRFVDELRKSVRKFYGDDPSASADYGRIVNERHHARLVALLEGGGFDEIAVGGHHDVATRYVAPTVLTGVKPEAAVMDEEIFGPILPVLSYSQLADAIEFVNQRPKPLALYVFADDKRTVEQVIDHTSAGGVSVNHTVLHLAVADLPFGGVGASGFGSYHGKAGFDRFSHAKPILHKKSKPDPSLAYPPYPGWKQTLLRKLL